ncbi:pikachurin [Osmerus eperlanus]|uniref:pikachurin n=1 Tax=Osmerus eperlanus TaxID=29151 RepID=UPI002E114B1E
MPRRHVSTITGYKVFYTEVRSNRLVDTAAILEVPLSLEMLTTGQFDGQASFDVVIGNLKVSNRYRVSVGAYGRGDPACPETSAPQLTRRACPRRPPPQPSVAPVSDTELALSWAEGESEGSAPVLHFLVAYIRPEMDTEWTYIREPIEARSMVMRGLMPDTEYQFVVRAVNTHGLSPPSQINNPVRTLATGVEEVGSTGGHGLRYVPETLKEEGFDVDDSDYDVFIEELKLFPGVGGGDSQRSQLRSRSGMPSSHPGRNVVYRLGRPPPNTTRTPPTPSPTFLSSSSSFPDSPATPELITLSVSPSTSPSLSPSTPDPSTPATLPPPTPAPSMTPWRGPVPRVYELGCDDTVCPPDSFCLSDYDSGGSQCHCILGRRGDVCSEGEGGMSALRVRGGCLL